ncbi:MAG: hypothetical protein LBI85_03770 [Spirochaetaceae bacterium]|nr:hypothetical protein [Spirochaetaceae bacterium]
MADGGVLRLRRRSGWEASDSGILLWRRNIGALLLFFALPYALIVSALCLAPRIMLPWAAFGLWWLNPLMDRLILHVISLRFFDYNASLSRLARSLVSIRAGLAGDLLWRRFSPWRGGRMPVRMLERLKGKAARKRIAALESGGLGFSATVTLLSMALNYALMAGEILFALSTINMLNLDIRTEVFQDHTRLFVVLYAVVNGINFLVVESLYVCMSFGVYINSRLETEGWDLELDFRRFAGQSSQGETQSKAPLLPGIVKVLALGILLLGFRLEPLYGENAAVITEENAALESLNEVLSSPDFGTTKDSWRIQFKKSEFEIERGGFTIPSWFSKVRHVFGLVVRALIFAAIASVLGFGLYRYLKAGNFPAKKRGWKSFALAGAEKKKRSAMLLEEAKELRRRGLVREAWARCFAAILAAFNERDTVVFPRDATEYGCLRLLRARDIPEAEAFNAFLRSWIDLAYGGRTLDAGRFDEALAFCLSIQGPAGE